jgi:hypothetical protein
MTLLDDYVRVSSRYRCPVCEHTDWCLLARDNPENPATAICARIESSIRWGDAGWLHRLRKDSTFVSRAMRSRTISISSRPPSIADQAERLQCRLEPERLHRAAADLSVTAASLLALGIGWASRGELARLGLHGLDGALSFPMRDADERVIGIRLRLLSGRKLAVPGSKNGLFIATKLLESTERLLVSEGESDCAALLDLGFTAVGRPGCTSGAQQLARLVHRLRLNAVIIVADNDIQGLRGASDLGRMLRINCADVRIVQPPDGLKDARDWKRAGATRDVLEGAIAAASPISISVRRATGGR